MSSQAIYYTHSEIKFDQESATRHLFSAEAATALKSGKGPFVTAVIGNHRATKKANGHDPEYTVSVAFLEAQAKSHESHCKRQGR